jgi:hypothetical protein
MIDQQAANRQRSTPRWVVPALTVWGSGYAAYRAYYGFGGRTGMVGVPASWSQFRAINLAAVVILIVAAAIPFAATRAEPDRWPRRVLPAVSLLAAVGCCMHAVIDIVLCSLSLAGVHPTTYPTGVWTSIDRHRANLQDLLGNEPWFLIEGLLWAALGVCSVRAGSRRAWCGSAIVAGALAIAVGVLSGLDVMGSWRFL